MPILYNPGQIGNSIVLLSIATLSLRNSLHGQAPMDVAEGTLKVSALAEEVFYYGFCEGDQVIFNFEEVNNKKLTELEILELPTSSKFMDYKTKKVNDQAFTVPTTGIYMFRFNNTALTNRICKFKIQRIPLSEKTKYFNTSVYWRTVFDTTYTTEEGTYLWHPDTTIIDITDQVAKVHSRGNLNGNKTTFNFDLPDNTFSWSYYVGVNQEGQKSYEKATEELTSHAAPIIAKIPTYGPLAALALGGISYLTKLQEGEDIDYYIVEGENVNLFLDGQPFHYIKKGKVINDFSRMTTPLTGSYHVCLANDNAITGVRVTVKITAIQINQVKDAKPLQMMHISPRQEPYLQN